MARELQPSRLEILFSDLLELFEQIDAAGSNKDDIQHLRDRLRQLGANLDEIDDDTIKDDTAKLGTTLEGSVVKNPDDKKKLNSYTQQVRNAIQEFDASLQSAINVNDDQTVRNSHETMDGNEIGGPQVSLQPVINVNQDQIARNTLEMMDDKEIALLLDKLLPVEFAQYSDANPCTPGTHVELLGQIQQWASGGEAPVFWLTGTVGTGKSAVTHTVSTSLNTSHIVATFFCSAAEGRNDPRRIIPTISDQLARRPELPSLRSAVAHALQIDGAIKDASFEVQLRNLIIKPFREMDPRTMTIVVVDSLDKCSNVEDVHAMLECISKHLQELPLNLKFFIASRPHARIRHAFRDIPPSKLKEQTLKTTPPPRSNSIMNPGVLIAEGRGDFSKSNRSNRPRSTFREETVDGANDINILQQSEPQDPTNNSGCCCCCCCCCC